MKGLILAGGLGTRLRPITRVVNKHLVPILNKPMITYPLQTLKHFGVTDIMIVAGGDHIGGIAEFFNDGSDYGVNLTYRVQKEAGGIAQALALAEDFVHGEKITAILGDNVFDNEKLEEPHPMDYEACVFVTRNVGDKTRFGVIRGLAMEGGPEILEKPQVELEEDQVVTGLYIYPKDVFDVIRTLKPSHRGELEITDVNNYYLMSRRLAVMPIPRDCFWSDAGTRESLKEAIDFAYDNE